MSLSLDLPDRPPRPVQPPPDHGARADRDEQPRAAAGGSGLVRVRCHSRADGTFVRSHFRVRAFRRRIVAEPA